MENGTTLSTAGKFLWFEMITVIKDRRMSLRSPRHWRRSLSKCAAITVEEVLTSALTSRHKCQGLDARPKVSSHDEGSGSEACLVLQLSYLGQSTQRSSTRHIWRLWTLELVFNSFEFSFSSSLSQSPFWQKQCFVHLSNKLLVLQWVLLVSRGEVDEFVLTPFL